MADESIPGLPLVAVSTGDSMPIVRASSGLVDSRVLVPIIPPSVYLGIFADAASANAAYPAAANVGRHATLGTVAPYVDSVSNGVAYVSGTDTSTLYSPTGLQPTGLAPSGTLAANGTLTLGTALNRIYDQGLYLYLPATAFSALPAGFYYVVMSSTTVGQVYTAKGGTLVVGSAAGYTGVIIMQPVASIIVPAGLMGLRGVIKFTANYVCNNNANAKNYMFNFGTYSEGPIVIASVLAVQPWIQITNAGDAKNQVTASNRVTSAAAPVSTMGIGAVDTTVDQMLTFSLSKDVATDYTILQNCYAELLVP